MSTVGTAYVRLELNAEPLVTALCELEQYVKENWGSLENLRAEIVRFDQAAARQSAMHAAYRRKKRGWR